MIHYTANYALAYVDEDTPVVDLAAASAEMAASVDAALTAGGVAPPGAQDLIEEASTRRLADEALDARLDALEAATWTLLSGAPAIGGAYHLPAYRKVGDVVELRGVVSNAPGSNAIFATLPAGFRPAKWELFPAVNGGEWIDVHPDGGLSRSGTGLVPLAHVRFSVAP